MDFSKRKCAPFWKLDSFSNTLIPFKILNFVTIQLMACDSLKWPKLQPDNVFIQKFYQIAYLKWDNQEIYKGLCSLVKKFLAPLHSLKSFCLWIFAKQNCKFCFLFDCSPNVGCVRPSQVVFKESLFSC